MKEKIEFYTILALILINTKLTLAQSTSASNNWVSGYYLGWSNVTTNPLDIKTAGTTRMTVLGTNGNVGIGITSPQRILDVKDNSGAPQLRLTYGTPYADIRLTNAGNLALLPTDGTNDGNVGIGITNPDGRLHSEYTFVNGATPIWNGKFVVTGNGSNGIQVEAVHASCTIQAGAATCTNFGGKFAASNASTNIGVGGFTSGTSSSSSTNYGVYGDAGGQSSTLFWAGYFNGQTFCTTGSWNSSDEMFKQDKTLLTENLATINQLKPYSYYFDTVQYKLMNFPSSKQYGLMAEDLQNVIPDLVRKVTSPLLTDDDGTLISDSLTFKAINYTELIPILIGAVQELSGKVNQLQDQLNSCCQGLGLRMNNDGNNLNNVPTENIELKDYIVLQQNVPNPFAEQTTITFSIPESVTKAELIFYDASGHMITSKEITSRGVSNLQVYSSDLSDGTYSYSLFADGKLIETKKMVRSKN